MYGFKVIVEQISAIDYQIGPLTKKAMNHRHDFETSLNEKTGEEILWGESFLLQVGVNMSSLAQLIT